MAKSANNTIASAVKPRQPIANKVVRKIQRHARAKVTDLSAFKVGRQNAGALQQTVTKADEMVGLHPAFALYTYVQNQVSVMTELLLELPEMHRFAKIVDKADELYMPEGPPMSPLTRSFFNGWLMYDATVGVARESLATVAMAVGSVAGMHAEFVRLIGQMSQSRMGIYLHEGFEKSDNEGNSSVRILLRELITDRQCTAICSSGYVGEEGELWYVRVLPPPRPQSESSINQELDVHVIVTTPYLLIDPSLEAWIAYFNRTLTHQANSKPIFTQYAQHMKYGSSPFYWTEFVFEAYVNHLETAIFLRGLPDVPESRPHSDKSH